MANTKGMFLETEISRPSEDISRLQLNLVDYEKYKSTIVCMQNRNRELVSFQDKG